MLVLWNGHMNEGMNNVVEAPLPLILEEILIQSVVPRLDVVIGVDAVNDAEVERSDSLVGVDFELTLVGNDNSGLEFAVAETVHAGSHGTKSSLKSLLLGDLRQKEGGRNIEARLPVLDHDRIQSTIDADFYALILSLKASTFAVSRLCRFHPTCGCGRCGIRCDDPPHPSILLDFEIVGGILDVEIREQSIAYQITDSLLEGGIEVCLGLLQWHDIDSAGCGSRATIGDGILERSVLVLVLALVLLALKNYYLRRRRWLNDSSHKNGQKGNKTYQIINHSRKTLYKKRVAKFNGEADTPDSGVLMVRDSIAVAGPSGEADGL
ncbi:hypothetical protein EDD21DRAFT_357151 [Dissophora ornata]|nr:hypothetical protein EDD21DRAFT_357151 [Dissophora ornata]